MKSLSFLTLMSTVLMIFTHSLYIGITSIPQCIELEAEPGKVIKFFYQSTGDYANETQVNFIPLNGNPSFQLTGWTNKTIISGETNTNVCFLSTDGVQRSVSFDFYTHDKAHLKQLALKSQLYELHNKLINVGESLKEISKNQMFQEQRQMIHTEMITRNQNTIKIFALVKILAIIIVALSQLFLIKNMLGKKGYQPVN